MTEPLQPLQPPPGAPPTRAGYVALIGRPNAGKSTLLNRLVGQHLSIVTPKPQTTCRRVAGIATSGGAQLVLLDTPGLLEPRDLMQRAMLAAALDAVAEADVVAVVVDACAVPIDRETAVVSRAMDRARVNVHAALNKVDRASADEVRAWSDWLGARGARVHPISALDGTGVEELRCALVADLPPGPFLYPPDDVASEPVRFFVAELVRETVFERYDQEVPYATWCRVEEFREDEDPVYIQVGLYVERPSQKGILIGAGGRAIRGLGEAARAKIEDLLRRRVYLDLWVKPLRRWRRDRNHLRRMGFRVPDDDATD